MWVYAYSKYRLLGLINEESSRRPRTSMNDLKEDVFNERATGHDD